MHISSLRARVRKQVGALRQYEAFYVTNLLFDYLIVPGFISASVMDLTGVLVASAGLMPYVTPPLYHLPFTVTMMVLIQLEGYSRHRRGSNSLNATLAFTNKWIACLATISALLFWSGITVSTETAANVWVLAQALKIGTALMQTTAGLFLLTRHEPPVGKPSMR